MANAGKVLKEFYDAVIKRDLAAARKYLSDDLLFVGLFETYRSADQYLAALTQLLSITVRLDPKKIIEETTPLSSSSWRPRPRPPPRPWSRNGTRSRAERSPTSSRRSMAGPSRPCSQARSGPKARGTTPAIGRPAP